MSSEHECCWHVKAVCCRCLALSDDNDPTKHFTEEASLLPVSQESETWQPIETASKGGLWLRARFADGTEADVTWSPFDCWRDREWRKVEPIEWKQIPEVATRSSALADKEP